MAIRLQLFVSSRLRWRNLPIIGDASRIRKALLEDRRGTIVKPHSIQ